VMEQAVEHGAGREAVRIIGVLFRGGLAILYPMRSIRPFVFAALLLFAPAAAFSKGSGHSSARAPRSTKCVGCARNSKDKIARSSTAKHQFERSNPCPSTGRTSGGCPGYVIDHKTALKHGGADSPSNMQWQSALG
jgi:hypothetical protein